MPMRLLGGSRATTLIYVKPGGDLGRLSGSRRNADAFGKGHKFRQGPNLHFLHHPVAMGLDGTFGTAQRAGDLLVGVAANDKVEDFPLARRQSPRDERERYPACSSRLASPHVARSPLDCPKQIIRRYRLSQNVSRTRFDGLYRDWDIEIASDENDWQRRTDWTKTDVRRLV